MKKQMLEDKKSIKFNCFGAIDFDEQINIELSLTNKFGFIEIHPLKLIEKFNELNHIQHIVFDYFYKILKKVPHSSDINNNLPEEKRFTQVFYKCYKKFHHSHEPYGVYHYSDLTIQDAIEYIKKENFAIIIPSTNDFLNVF